jgi:hypothetical protein
MACATRAAGMANVEGAGRGAKDREDGDGDGDGDGSGKEKKTRQQSYISIGDTSEPTIHMALESTVSPTTAVITISIDFDLPWSKWHGSSHDICSF